MAMGEEDLDPTLALKDHGANQVVVHTLANKEEEDNLLVDTLETPTHGVMVTVTVTLVMVEETLTHGDKVTHGDSQTEVAHGDKEVEEEPKEGLDMDQEETQVVIHGDKVQIMDGLQIVKDVEETLVDGEEELLDGELHLLPTVKVGDLHQVIPPLNLKILSFNGGQLMVDLLVLILDLLLLKMELLFHYLQLLFLVPNTSEFFQKQQQSLSLRFVQLQV